MYRDIQDSTAIQGCLGVNKDTRDIQGVYGGYTGFDGLGNASKAHVFEMLGRHLLIARP